MQEIFLFNSAEPTSLIALNKKLKNGWQILSSNLVSTKGNWYIYAYLLEKVFE